MLALAVLEAGAAVPQEVVHHLPGGAPAGACKESHGPPGHEAGPTGGGDKSPPPPRPQARLQEEGIGGALPRHVTAPRGPARRYGIDPTKIKNDLGWYPETPFEKGIVLTIDWYLAHEDWMDHVTSGSYQKYYEEMYKNK